MTTLHGWYGAPVTAPPPPVLGPHPPRYGEPGWTIWPHRVWPLDPLAAAPRRLVMLAVIVGVLGTAVWRISVLSVGYLFVDNSSFQIYENTIDVSIGSQVRERLARKYRLVKHAGFLDVYQRL